MTFISSSAFAGSQLSRLQQIAPDEYESTRQTCVQWAEDDQLEAMEKTAYVDSCILDAIGYLVEVNEEQVEEEQSTENDNDDVQVDNES